MISGNSDEIIRTATPLGQGPDHVVNAGFRLHIDASVGSSKMNTSASEASHGQHDFLLIAAAQVLGFAIE
jgi:hypothetical protein